MARSVLVLCAMAICSLHTSAQIEVTATAGTVGPTSYTNLRLAFVAINAGTHQGAITVAITSSPSPGLQARVPHRTPR